MLLSDKLSKNFRAYELAEHAGEQRRWPDDPDIELNLCNFAVRALQPLREAWERFLIQNNYGGSPVINVASGWRSPEHNARVGGAKDSWHMCGLAADLYCDVDMWELRSGCGTERDAERMELFASFVEKHIDRTDVIGGFGIYRYMQTDHVYWVHVDMRPRVDGRVARWIGLT